MHAPEVRGSPASACVFRGVTGARSPGMAGTPKGRQGWEGTLILEAREVREGQCFRRLIGGQGAAWIGGRDWNLLITQVSGVPQLHFRTNLPELGGRAGGVGA